MKNNPIGVFDSGIGGLTVVKEIIKLLPHENILYLGDTARVPYGTRGKETITTFALEMVRFLLAQDVKCLVVACNTISATCLNEIKAISSVPVIDVIKPSVKKIIASSITKQVGVIGTPATIQSHIYRKEITLLDPQFNITEIACPLFVPIAEEGLGESDIALLAAKHYLEKLNDIDTLHLGCTHYPLLKHTIREVVGENVRIIDSAEPTAEALRDLLVEKKITKEKKDRGIQTFYVTDAPNRVERIAKLFLGTDNTIEIKKVSLSKK